MYYIHIIHSVSHHSFTALAERVRAPLRGPRLGAGESAPEKEPPGQRGSAAPCLWVNI